MNTKIYLQTIYRLFLLIVFTTLSVNVTAHEVTPTIIEIEAVSSHQITLKIDTNLEALMTEIGADHTNTDDAPQAEEYNALRSLTDQQLAEKATPFINAFIEKITLLGEGDQRVSLSPSQVDLSIKPQSDLEIARESLISYTLDTNVELATPLTFSWPSQFGDSVVRVIHQGEAAGALWVKAGTSSDPFELTAVALEQSLIDYVVIGFEHILPLGLDHILFVLGIYLLSQRLKDLLWQVTAFTAAHTLTLGLAILGYVSVSPSIVEPLIALSICYVAIENLFHKQISTSRVVLVFAFGLLHGLGFAGVLSEIGLNQDAFIPSLIAFNVGVELGQLAVITLAYIIAGYWFGEKPYWNKLIRVPVSLLIALTGAFWVVERVFY